MDKESPIDTTAKKTRKELLQEIDRLRDQPPSDPFIVVLTGQDKGKKYFLMSVVTIIGRSDTCNIRIKDPLVSGSHAKIRMQPEAFHIDDLDSSNGTWLNGRKISSAELRSGDRITMGSTELLFTRPGPCNVPIR